MKIYITGSVASGKTTLSKKISNITQTPYYCLDGVVHVDNKNSELGNYKRTTQERDSIFNSIIYENSWIIEDTGRKCFASGFEEADNIILLAPRKITKYNRIIVRFIKQKLGLENSLYRPNIKMLKLMFSWLNNYHSPDDDLKPRINQYKDKLIILKTHNDIKKYIDSIKTNNNIVGK